LAQVHPAVHVPPPVQRSLRDPVAPAALAHLRARVRLPQDPDDLLLRKSALPHGLLRTASHHSCIWFLESAQERLPLIYLHRMVEGRYLATWPVLIVGDDPARLSLTVAVEDPAHVILTGEVIMAVGEGAVARREYVT